jgi:acyl-CoA reductase-like NAD-dependent aldehyde dehydrogenase
LGFITFNDSWNHGQACCAGSRIFVQAGIYDEFLKRLSAKAHSIKVGDPFGENIDQGPQVSQIQYDVRLILFSLPLNSALRPYTAESLQ